jgi:hypothetical protein
MSKNAAEQCCLFSRASFVPHMILCLFYCGVLLLEAELVIGKCLMGTSVGNKRIEADTSHYKQTKNKKTKSSMA